MSVSGGMMSLCGGNSNRLASNHRAALLTNAHSSGRGLTGRFDRQHDRRRIVTSHVLGLAFVSSRHQGAGAALQRWTAQQDLSHPDVAQHLPYAIRNHEKDIARREFPVAEVHHEMRIEAQCAPQDVTQIAARPDVIHSELPETTVAQTVYARIAHVRDVVARMFEHEHAHRAGNAVMLATAGVVRPDP